MCELSSGCGNHCVGPSIMSADEGALAESAAAVALRDGDAAAWHDACVALVGAAQDAEPPALAALAEVRRVASASSAARRLLAGSTSLVTGIAGALRACACRRCAALRVREAFTTTILVRDVRQFEECAVSWRVT